MESINLAKALRALRRAADLSQRELAARAGLPRSTVGKIEAGEISNPTFRTVERLVNAAGGHITLSVSPEPLQDSGVTELLALAKARTPDDIPHEDLTDTAGRHYPAHLDVRATYPPFAAEGSPVRPRTRVDTYELNRLGRDLTRENRAPANAVQVDHRELTPGHAWEWTESTADGRQVGWLGAQMWPDLDVSRGEPDTRRGLLCRLRIARGWEATGVDERLVAELRAWQGEYGPIDIYTLGGESSVRRLRNLGFLATRNAPKLLKLSAE